METHGEIDGCKVSAAPQFSKVEISRLIDCVELLCETRKPELTLIRRVI